MIATKEFLEKFVNENNIDCLLGANEISTEKFIKWFDEVKDNEINGIHIKQFDVVSAIELFEQDLIEFNSTNKES